MVPLLIEFIRGFFDQVTQLEAAPSIVCVLLLVALLPVFDLRRRFFAGCLSEVVTITG